MIHPWIVSQFECFSVNNFPNHNSLKGILSLNSSINSCSASHQVSFDGHLGGGDYLRVYDPTFKSCLVKWVSHVLLFYPRLLHLTWKKDADGAIGMIKKALAIDSKCDFAYETLGTIEVQRYDKYPHTSLPIISYKKNSKKKYNKLDMCCLVTNTKHQASGPVGTFSLKWRFSVIPWFLASEYCYLLFLSVHSVCPYFLFPVYVLFVCLLGSSPQALASRRSALVSVL